METLRHLYLIILNVFLGARNTRQCFVSCITVTSTNQDSLRHVYYSKFEIRLTAQKGASALFATGFV